MGPFSIERLDARWINLDHREDRRRQMEPVVETFEAMGIPIMRLQAFAPKDWDATREQAPYLYGTKTAGNWLSHTFLIQFAAETGRDIIVLEDDVFVASDICERLQHLEMHMTMPWDYIALCGTFHLLRNTSPPGNLWHKELGRDVELTPVKHVLRAYGVWSNHGYIINGKTAGRTLEMMRSVMHKARGSDGALIMIQPQIEAYVFVPGMVFQHDGISDVAEGEGHVTKFSAFKKMGPYVYQDRLDGFDYDSFDFAEADTGAYKR